MERQPVCDLPDDALLQRVHSLSSDVRRTTVELIELLAEMDARQLHLAHGCPSLFEYCRARLHMSEGEAGNRLVAARAGRRFPLALELLRSGAVNMTTVRLLAPHLTESNHRAVLEEASGKSRPQVEEIVVRLAPRPVAASSLRAVPLGTASPGATPVVVSSADVAAQAGPATATPPAMPPATPPAARPAVAPVAPELYRLSVTITRETRELWERLQALVSGDDAVVLARALAAALPALEKQKFAATDRPRPRRAGGGHPDSRHVPADVRRIVWARDQGRCAFAGRHGERCSARRDLQFHHVKPWMAGGPMTPENIQLRCGAHNRYEATVFFAAASAARRSDAAP